MCKDTLLFGFNRYIYQFSAFFILIALKIGFFAYFCVSNGPNGMKKELKTRMSLRWIAGRIQEKCSNKQDNKDV